jgi:hypothetical protein
VFQGNPAGARLLKAHDDTGQRLELPEHRGVNPD